MTTPEHPDDATGRTTIDGVPVHWQDLRTDPAAHLVLAVGYRDAAPAQAGLSHLVEHLVMRRAAADFPTANAYSGPDETVFHVTGSTEVRMQFLARVCEALTWIRDVDDASLDVERRTILAEVGEESLWASPGPFALRFGTEDLGNLELTHGRLLDWTAVEVRDFAAQHLHRGSVALVLTDRPWDGIRLPLPDGPRRRRTVPEQRLTSRTVHVSSVDGGVLWTGVADGSHGPAARLLALTLLERVLLDALRTQTGQVYAVNPASFPLDDGDVLLVAVEIPPHAFAAAVPQILASIGRIVTDGPTEPELADARRTALARAETSDQQVEALLTRATLDAVGTPREPVTAGALAAVTADDVHAVLRDAASSALLTLPPADEVDDALAEAEKHGYTLRDATDDPDGLTLAEVVDATFDVRGTLRGTSSTTIHNGKLFGGARGTSVAVRPDRLVLLARGTALTLLLDELVLAGTDADGDVELVTSRGGVAVLRPKLFRGLPAALDRALERAPHVLRYDKSRVAMLAPGDEAPHTH